MTNLELQKMANEVRKGIITGVHAAKAGHPGGSLSAADIFRSEERRVGKECRSRWSPYH